MTPTYSGRVRPPWTQERGHPHGFWASCTGAFVQLQASRTTHSSRKAAACASSQQVAAVPQDVLYKIFGRDLSMGKGQGLLGMLEVVQHDARRVLAERRTQAERSGA